MKIYLDDNYGTKEFAKKSESVKKLINEALFIIESFGIPFDDLSPRRLEKMALSFLAVLNVKSSDNWKEANDLSHGKALVTRDVIKFINQHFDENISSGSYDDIRRKDLKLLVLAGVVLNSKPNNAMNDSTRGYALNPAYTPLVHDFSQSDEWLKTVSDFMQDRPKLSELLAAERDIEKIPIKLPEGTEILFSQGAHNVLQKEIIENFLPRYGYGAEVLYVGDTADKDLYLLEDRLKELHFFELDHGKLPDVVAYAPSKNWLYLIEAVHSSGPISDERKIELEQLTKDCTADIIYITAFLDKDTYRKFVKDVAWETEVWIASSPDHLIHFNGDKFMGPYKG